MSRRAATTSVKLGRSVSTLARHRSANAYMHPRNKTEFSSQLLDMPSVVGAKFHDARPSRGVSSGTPYANRLACLGIRGGGGAQHANERTKPHLGTCNQGTIRFSGSVAHSARTWMVLPSPVGQER